MANTSALQTYQAVGNREGLTDVISIVAREEAPMYNAFAKESIASSYAEWQTYALASATSNAAIEGAAYSYTRPSTTSRLGGYTQILTKTFEVSRTQDLVDAAGRKNGTFNFTKGIKLREILRDIEYALVNGTGNSGASGTARALKGVLSWITTNVTTGTGTGTETLTETMFNNNLQAVWEQGGKPMTTYVNGWQKRKISGFSTNTRNVSADAEKLFASVDIYVSDFGVIKVVLDHQMTTTVAATLQDDLWKIGTLDALNYKDTYLDGDSKTGRWLFEGTLMSLNEKGSGKITGLKTA